MSSVCSFSTRLGGRDNLGMQLRARINTLSYLPTTVAVAMKFVELGKNIDAGPEDYCKVIGSDPSLSSKILSLANSSWFGVRNRVTKLQVAINLLGLGTVRTLAISYCLTGLHNNLKLSAEESCTFWTASLCKAVMARRVAALSDDKHADEAFTAALFQDFAIPVMFTIAREPIWNMFSNSEIDTQARLQQERELFGLDHAEVGRAIAQRLELPDLFVDAIAFHHKLQNLREFITHKPLADALHAAALCPHSLNKWNRGDTEQLGRHLRSLGVQDPTEFLQTVANDFADLYRYFEQGECPAAQLSELIILATRELADSTTQMVENMQFLQLQTSGIGQDVNQLVNQHRKLEEAASHDPLTGALNREGFNRHGSDLIGKASRYGITMAVVYLDIDHFKKLNDTCGHAAGDKALRTVARIMQETVRQTDLVGRFGGDEFVLLLNDCNRENAQAIVERILSQVYEMPMSESVIKAGIKPSLSAGIIIFNGKGNSIPLDNLIARADELMYQSKRSGGNRMIAA